MLVPLGDDRPKRYVQLPLTTVQPVAEMAEATCVVARGRGAVVGAVGVGDGAVAGGGGGVVVADAIGDGVVTRGGGAVVVAEARVRKGVVTVRGGGVVVAVIRLCSGAITLRLCGVAISLICAGVGEDADRGGGTAVAIPGECFGAVAVRDRGIRAIRGALGAIAGGRAHRPEDRDTVHGDTDIRLADIGGAVAVGVLAGVSRGRAVAVRLVGVGDRGAVVRLVRDAVAVGVGVRGDDRERGRVARGAAVGQHDSDGDHVCADGLVGQIDGVAAGLSSDGAG